ncbi:class D beta-lactamase [Rhizobium sp. ACO-34A]|nr:class D beta-lactamase [Rhizobium sp. ACO-34A]
MAFCRRMFLGFSFGFSAFVSAGFPAFSAEPVHCTVIIDEVSGDTLYRKGQCGETFSPMSTFKLPLAMMGYDAGILQDESNPRWDYRAELDRPKREQKATDPTIWEKDSIVWYSQEITRRLGERRFADYVQRFGYGNRDVAGNSGKKDGLTQSWLMSSLKISPDEQVAFLRRFLTGGLPVSAHASDMTLAIVPHFAAGDGWDIQGKTGSGLMRDKTGKADRSRPLGWFVGWATKGDRRVIFARLNIANRPSDQPLSISTRDSLIAEFPGIATRF